MTFQEFMRKVDAELIKLCGLPSDDIDDWRYAADHAEGRTPLATAKRAIRNAKSASGM